MDAKTRHRLAAELHAEMVPLLMKAIVRLFENDEAKVVMTTGDIRGQAHASLTICLDQPTTRGIAELILPGEIGKETVN